MQSLRQLGSGVIVALVSVILVIGGISLALAETLPPPATPSQIPPTLPLSFFTPTHTPTLQIVFTSTSEIPTETATSSPTATLLPPTACTPPSGWIAITTSPGDTIYNIAQRYHTTTEILSTSNCLPSINLPAGYRLFVPPVVSTATAIPCGPPANWVKTHVVQAGDNLYRIALSYGIKYPQLQVANCMGSSVLIYPGQRLWVPNVPTLTPIPGVTIIPDFPTNTPAPTATSTNTSVPPTSTVPPSATPSPQVTSTFIATSTVPPATATASITSFPTQTTSP